MTGVSISAPAEACPDISYLSPTGTVTATRLSVNRLAYEERTVDWLNQV